MEIGVAWNEIYQLRAFLQFNSAYRIEFFSDYAARFLKPEIEASIPLHRVATAEDIAGPVLFLASPLARHITGEILNVNGGSVLVG